MNRLKTNKRDRLAHHRRMMTWSLVLMVLAIVLLPLSGYVYQAAAAKAQAQPESVQDTGQWQDNNPRANYWRDVRAGATGYTADKDVNGVLIQSAGQNWRELRNGPIITIGALGMLVALLAIVFFHYRKGRVKLEKGRSGRSIERWSYFERFVHWSTAVLFIVMAITGLSTLYGRIVLIPILGKDGFAAYASVTKILHNYLGILFVICIAVMVAMWMKNNVFKKVDREWLKSGGGLFGGGHASSEKVNGGEKLWFWLISSAGIVVCITGLVMDFPNFGWGRSTMQLSNMTHAVLALIWISVAFGHIYIGTLGTEGSLEAMTTGKVDEEWAKQHHDLWYEENSAKPAGETKSEPAGTGSTSTI
jgi:formate dehydrogenase subunit gamma